MKLTMGANSFVTMARVTGDAVATKGQHHPILAYVVFDTIGEVPHALAASPVGIVRYDLASAGRAGAGRFAIRQDHLAALAQLTQALDTVELVADDDFKRAVITVSNTKGPTGVWTVPVANAADLAHFPDEPEIEGTAHAWAASDFARALRQVRPCTTPDGTVMLQGQQVFTSTWGTAVITDLEEHTGEPVETTHIPGAGATLLWRAYQGASQTGFVRAHLGERLHFELGPITHHLMGYALTPDDLATTFFGGSHPTGQAVDRAAFADAIRRAAPFCEHVRIGSDGAHLHIHAADGTSTQRVPLLTPGPGREPSWTVYQAAPLRDLLLSVFTSANVHVTLPGEGSSFLYLADDHNSTVTAMVPLQDIAQ